MAIYLQSYEAEILDLVLANLHRLPPGCDLVMPIYDGLLITAPAEASEEAAGALGTLLARGARKVLGTEVGVTTKTAARWPT
jgi:hypothetical protein